MEQGHDLAPLDARGPIAFSKVQCLEFLVHFRTNELRFYVYGGPVVGVGSASSGLSAYLYAGVVSGLQDPKDYSGPSNSFTLTFGSGAAQAAVAYFYGMSAPYSGWVVGWSPGTGSGVGLTAAIPIYTLISIQSLSGTAASAAGAVKQLLGNLSNVYAFPY